MDAVVGAVYGMVTTVIGLLAALEKAMRLISMESRRGYRMEER